MTKENIGLYRDDGLVATSLTSQQAENMSKKIHAVFKSEALSVKISSVDFLDVTMHLDRGKYEPYRKEETLLA